MRVHGWALHPSLVSLDWPILATLTRKASYSNNPKAQKWTQHNMYTKISWHSKVFIVEAPILGLRLGAWTARGHPSDVQLFKLLMRSIYYGSRASLFSTLCTPCDQSSFHLCSLTSLLGPVVPCFLFWPPAQSRYISSRASPLFQPTWPGTRLLLHILYCWTTSYSGVHSNILFCLFTMKLSCQ